MDYLGKKKVKVYKQEFSGIVNDLKDELGDGWNFHYYLVGSAKRNMVIKSNEGFDLDYHLMLKDWPDELTDKQLKLTVMEAFDNVTPNHLSNSKDSTNVITINCVENEVLKYSYDIALMHKTIGSNILKNEKDDGSNGPYHFVQVSDSSSFFERFHMIKGHEMWRDLRSIYFDKKIEQHQDAKDVRIYSFALLKEATNDVLLKYKLI